MTADKSKKINPVIPTEHGFIVRRRILSAGGGDGAGKIPHKSVRNDGGLENS